MARNKGFDALATLRASLPPGTPVVTPAPKPEPVVIVPSVGTDDDLEARRAAHIARKDAELQVELDAIACWEMEKLREVADRAAELGPDVLGACYVAIAAKHGTAIGTVEVQRYERFGPWTDGEGLRHGGGSELVTGTRPEYADEYHARLKALEPAWFEWAIKALVYSEHGPDEVRREARMMARNKKFRYWASGPSLAPCPWEA